MRPDSAPEVRLPRSKILLAFGTRPEAIKLGPVAAELAAAKVEFGVLATGQHRELLAGTAAETDLARAESLGLASEGNVVRWLMHARTRVRAWLREHEEYDPVVVQGDTMSALAVARAAGDVGRAVVHVEAGVRSHDRANPWPEEQTRVELTELARWHYAPTPTAWANLVEEGVASTFVVLSGNPIVSALARYTAARPTAPQSHILVTLHRREWLLGDCVAETISALADAARAEPRVEFIWPVHPAVHARVNGAFGSLPGNVIPTGPLEYGKCARVLASALGVLTDSGGLQEEAATLGVPCAVMRTVTDRPESVQAGVARCFAPDASGVAAAVECLVRAKLKRQPLDVFGTPESAARIARHLAQVASVS